MQQHSTNKGFYTTTCIITLYYTCAILLPTAITNAYSWLSTEAVPSKLLGFKLNQQSKINKLRFLRFTTMATKLTVNSRVTNTCLQQQEESNSDLIGDGDDNKNYENVKNDMQQQQEKNDCTQHEQDLTDRFKYKVNALMGAFDPIDSTTDTESTSGNIFNALLKFPLQHTFHVVGKTGGDDTIQSLFVQQVKDTIIQSSYTPILLTTDGSETDDDNNNNSNDIQYEVTNRGTKFTKITIQKEVINAEEITFIYNQLSKLELSVMQF